MPGKLIDPFERYPIPKEKLGKIFGDYQLDPKPHKLITPDRRNPNSLIFPATHLPSHDRIMIKFDTSPREYGEIDLGQYTRHEFDVLTSFDHPNIPKVYEVVKAKLSSLDEREFSGLAMQLIDGTSLDEIMDFCQESELSPNLPHIFDKLTQIADALYYSHTHGYVQEDVKPGNILIETATQFPFLIDWETAEKVGIMPEHISATRKYLCPEKVDDYINERMGNKNSARKYVPNPSGDVYSLSVLCYELITGREPYDQIISSHVIPGILDQLDRIKDKPFTRLSTLPHLKDQLDTITLEKLDAVFTRALDKNPKSRLQDPRLLISTILQIIRESKIQTLNYE